ncbi:MAG: DUF4138 domain-containing protein [Bacteroidetes bacterium]|nr:DUF4138 domain-containing protein [Bacteroidota bacterium]
MKRIVIVLLSLVSHLLLSQNNKQIDTIYCDSKNTSYLIFYDKVELVDVGNPDNYVAQIEESAIFVKALKPSVEPTTILVKIGKNFHFGILLGLERNNKNYYDFTKLNGGGEEKNTKGIEAANSSEKKNPLDLTAKIETLLATKNEMHTLGSVSKFLETSIPVIRNDKEYTYLKLVVKNKSSIPYKVDFISFQYFEDQKKGVGKKRKKVPRDEFPINENKVKEIESGQTVAIPFVIKSYALSNNGYLMVLVREASGNRVLKIKVEGSIIQKAPQF